MGMALKLPQDKHWYCKRFAIAKGDHNTPKFVTMRLGVRLYYMSHPLCQDTPPIPTKDEVYLDDFGFIAFPSPKTPGHVEFIKAFDSDLQWQGTTHFILPFIDMDLVQ